MWLVLLLWLGLASSPLLRALRQSPLGVGVVLGCLYQVYSGLLRAVCGVQTSIATIVTVEQAALYLAQGDTNTAGTTAEAFLRTLTTLQDGAARGGGVYACIRDVQCLREALVDTVQSIEDAEAATATTVTTQESSQVVAAEAPIATVTLDSAPVDGFATGVQLPMHILESTEKVVRIVPAVIAVGYIRETPDVPV